jgi:hypothetical protein
MVDPNWREINLVTVRGQGIRCRAPSCGGDAGSLAGCPAIAADAEKR